MKKKTVWVTKLSHLIYVFLYEKIPVASWMWSFAWWTVHQTAAHKMWEKLLILKSVLSSQAILLARLWFWLARISCIELYTISPFASQILKCQSQKKALAWSSKDVLNVLQKDVTMRWREIKLNGQSVSNASFARHESDHVWSHWECLAWP